MNPLYEKYKNLKIDGSWIGLEAGTQTPCFCTPIGAEIIGWDNGIHYCFIKGFGDMVFCVNPETCCDYNVYPIARNFCDFLGLILATGNTNTLQQIIWWDKKRFEDFVNSPEEQEYRVRPEVQGVLSTIRKGIDIAPIDTLFEYIKDLQSNFPYEQIPFTNEYYDTLGIERPDGTEPEGNGFEFRTVEFKVDKN
ncbi:MAG: hypothetical protein HFF71_07015 [Oscillospiraceae bacterium]|jgi:hypothetical protein|nr:hypothetical protein [Oscillospiraceae bacterium]